MVLSFEEFLNESQGVVLQVNGEPDKFGISKIVNEFLDIISKNSNNKHTTCEMILQTPIRLSYEPLDNPIKRGEMIDNKIFIYEKLTNINYLEIKYLIIHELTHIIQNVMSKKIKKIMTNDKLKYMLLKPNYNQIVDEKTKYFAYLLYRENIFEISAWSNDAYITAFKYKMENPDMSNQDIMNNVLSDIHMSHDFLEQTNYLIENDNEIFKAIIGMLVGHFSELGGIPNQTYFDKSVFKLPIIKKMRREVKDVMTGIFQFNETVSKILNIMKKYTDELIEIKDKIIPSFIEHLNYWFEKAKKQLGKSIQLGIEDATK